jgi:hypothetical protein
VSVPVRARFKQISPFISRIYDDNRRNVNDPGSCDLNFI